MGVPKSVLTDNMKSVVVKRLCDGSPVWNKEYDVGGKMILPPHGKENFTLHGKQFFTLPVRRFLHAAVRSF